MTGSSDNPAPLASMYREQVMDHARNPRNFGRIDAATHEAEGLNPLCGDRLTMSLRIDANNSIERIAFDGSGCAISLASASMLTESVLHKDIDTALRQCQRVLEHLNDGDDVGATDLDFLSALSGVRQHPSRVRCATLAWKTLQTAFQKNPLIATTEQA